MDITAHSEPDRVLRNAVLGIDGIAQVDAGTRIIYHKGKTWSLSETARKIGDVARQLADAGHVILAQQKVGDDEYHWLAIVKAIK